jgi:hypothetical protein
MRCGRAFRSFVALVALAVPVAAWSVGTAGAVAAAADSGQVRFADPQLQVVEDGGVVRVGVERVDLPVSRMVVAYRSEDASAHGGEDYVATSGTLVFDVGVRSSLFTVTVRDDVVAEGTEHLLLHLETSSGGGSSSRLTIFDDDVAEEAPVAAAPVRPQASASSSGASAPVVVAASAGASRPVPVPVRPAIRTVRRPSAARVATPRRITLQQNQVKPFELHPLAGDDAGPPLEVDPVLALIAGLLLARVGAEVWFRTRLWLG